MSNIYDVIQARTSSRTSNGKSEWTVHDTRLAIGMQLMGASAAKISEALENHSKASVTNLLSVRLKTFSQEAIEKKLGGMMNPDDLIQYAKDHLEANFEIVNGNLVKKEVVEETA